MSSNKSTVHHIKKNRNGLQSAICLQPEILFFPTSNVWPTIILKETFELIKYFKNFFFFNTLSNLIELFILRSKVAADKQHTSILTAAGTIHGYNGLLSQPKPFQVCHLRIKADKGLCYSTSHKSSLIKAYKIFPRVPFRRESPQRLKTVNLER